MKETKEVMIAAARVGAMIVKELKDGFQITDIPKIMSDVASDPECIAALAAAKDNITLVPTELKNINALDGLELAETGIEIARLMLTELKK